jgi:hypothetical protein
MKLDRLIKMCLNKTYNKVCIGENLYDDFPIPSGLKQGDALPPLLFEFFFFFRIRHKEGPKN